jgi:hypothetical protein
MPHQLTRGQGIQFELLNRPISNQVIEFNNAFPDWTVDNMFSKVMKLDAKSVLVPFDSPFIEIYNCMNENAQITGPSPGLEAKNQVMLRTKTFKTYAPITRDALKNQFSRANITNENGLQLIFSRPVPPHRLKEHRRAVANKGNGIDRTFLGYADRKPGEDRLISINFNTASVSLKKTERHDKRPLYFLL